jgi:L-lactate dehydrogenase
MRRRNVTIVGFGKVGSLIAKSLLEDQRHIWTINIMDPYSSQHRHGKILDLLHSLPLYPLNSICLNDESMFSQADYIVYSASGASVIKKDRCEVLEENLTVAQSVFKGRSFEKKEVILITLSNPVDLMAHHLQRLTNFPPHNIISTGTFIDSIRAAHYISHLIPRFKGIHASQLYLPILGEHGESMVPIFSQFSLNQSLLPHSVRTSDAQIFSEAERDLILNSTKRAAAEIKRTEGSTSIGVSSCALRLLHLLEDGPIVDTVIPLCVSLPSHYAKLLQINQTKALSLPLSGELYLSLPILFRQRGGEGWKAGQREMECIPMSLNPAELQGLQNSAQKLLSLIHR